MGGLGHYYRGERGSGYRNISMTIIEEVEVKKEAVEVTTYVNPTTQKQYDDNVKKAIDSYILKTECNH